MSRATTADRIRQCGDVGDEIVDLVTTVMIDHGDTKAVAEKVMDRLQELWDAAYEAGRTDGANDSR